MRIVSEFANKFNKLLWQNKYIERDQKNCLESQMNSG